MGVPPAAALSEYSPSPFSAVNTPFCYTAINNSPTESLKSKYVDGWALLYLLSSRIQATDCTSPPPQRAREKQAVLQMQPRIHLGPSAAPSQIFPELFSSRLLPPRSLRKIGHLGSLTTEKLKTGKKGSNVSTKLSHTPHGQPRKIFLDD